MCFPGENELQFTFCCFRLHLRITKQAALWTPKGPDTAAELNNADVGHGLSPLFRRFIALNALAEAAVHPAHRYYFRSFIEQTLTKTKALYYRGYIKLTLRL